MVREGETLESIARAYYGDARLAGMISGANMHAIDSRGGIAAGTTLRIPLTADDDASRYFQRSTPAAAGTARTE
jgi:nucleoid-associated protein YgaU